MQATIVTYLVVTDALDRVEVTYYPSKNEWQVEFLSQLEVDKIAFPGQSNKIMNYIDAVEHAANFLGINSLYKKTANNEPNP